MSHVYCVTVPATTIYVEADSKAQARSMALSGVTIDRLDGGAILALHRRGQPIMDASTALLKPDAFDQFVSTAGIIDTTRSEYTP